MQSRERREREGDVEAGYFGGNSLLITGMKFQLGNRKISCWYSCICLDLDDTSYNRSELHVSIDDSSCAINFIGGSVKSVLSSNKKAIWETVNGVASNSPERLEKARVVLDYFTRRIKEIPLAEKYLDGFEAYRREYAEEEKREKEEGRKRYGGEKRRDEEKLRGTPDPLNNLAEIVEAELKN
jgi:hypothetical protein